MSSSQESKKKSPPQSQLAVFTFVSDETQHGARSHAMRQHWKLRRQRLITEKEKHEDSLLRPRPILSHASDMSDGAASDQLPSAGSGSDSTSRESKKAIESEPRHGSSPSWTGDSIPSQALSGMNVALGSCKLDPFDKFPVKFTHRHHHLLHHWLATYSTMVFDRLAATDFNPMRDVWLPLDLSNAASFNALMAHSAAHLARMQGYRNSDTALRFKAEAIRIVTEWMGDPKLCMSDEIIAAVLRLLTYERYWGTEAEWRVHHEGLLQLIRARGGIEALRPNWRVSLPSYLVSLMGGPSWFDTSNQIWEISSQHDHEWAMNNVHKIRCLWLLSFVQDIGTFVCNNPDVYADGLVRYPAAMDALGVLHAGSRQSRPPSTPDDQTPCRENEFKRLACLLFFCVMVQNSFTAAESASTQPNAHTLLSFDTLLDHSRPSWQGSVDGLYDTLFHGSLNSGNGESKTHYVLNMARVLGSLSLEARRGVESCLLYIMRRVRGVNGDDFFDDSQPTPDYLLASIHGD